MSSSSVERPTDRRGARRHVEAWLFAASLAAWCVPWSAHAELPIQDNELILGVAAGGIIFSARDDSGEQTLHGGGHHELFFLGLMNRGLPWLDAELAMTFSALWFTDGGLEQSHRGAVHHARFLPGFALRGSAYLRVPSLPYRLGLGVVGSLYPAPAIGTLLRAELEPSFGVDLMRTAQEHLSLDFIYGLPLFDDFTTESGLSIEPLIHRLSVRASYGF